MRYSTQMPLLSYPALACGFPFPSLSAAKSGSDALADVSTNSFDAAVNRKVDGTFTDMTQ
ncbi:hypothetical protein C9I57_18330 [Trinickia symbiotica]|uniref:Uncharacterized protein n=1 Tax=Trinickia symbiotica TaxID=863227 RepID=A0A2N7X3P9_9BURK|nr:hypothetical protein C0Z20_15375 [Trinickia symbiotica]PTB19628.1 hypothetical protein C9I57_18330 [Trinickia symbiotica]